mgnify:CR=1 FL=1
MKFEDLNLHPALLKAVKAQNYTTPTAIQKQAIPLILKENDVDTEIILYLETPPSVEELKNILNKLNLSPREIIRKGEDEYKSYNLNNENLSDQELIGVMSSNPKLIERPIVVHEDRAVIGGCLGIHQFVHIGSLAMVGGMTRVDRDVPPYCLVEGHPGRLRGLNKVGLRRSGFENNAGGELRQLQNIWTLLFRSGHVISEGLKLASEEELMPASTHLCDFLQASIQKGRRGPMPISSLQN